MKGAGAFVALRGSHLNQPPPWRSPAIARCLSGSESRSRSKFPSLLSRVNEIRANLLFAAASQPRNGCSKIRSPVGILGWRNGLKFQEALRVVRVRKEPVSHSVHEICPVICRRMEGNRQNFEFSKSIRPSLAASSVEPASGALGLHNKLIGRQETVSLLGAHGFMVFQTLQFHLNGNATELIFERAVKRVIAGRRDVFPSWQGSDDIDGEGRFGDDSPNSPQGQVVGSAESFENNFRFRMKLVFDRMDSELLPQKSKNLLAFLQRAPSQQRLDLIDPAHSANAAGGGRACEVGNLGYPSVLRDAARRFSAWKYGPCE